MITRIVTLCLGFAALSGCLNSNNTIATVTAPIAGNAGVPVFTPTFAQPGVSFDQQIGTAGITGFISDNSGNQAIRLFRDQQSLALTVEFQNGSTVALPDTTQGLITVGNTNSFATYNSPGGTIRYNDLSSDFVSLSLGNSITNGSDQLDGALVVGVQTDPATISARTGGG